MSGKQLEMLVTLMEITYAGRAAWHETNVPRQFALHLRSGTVLLDEFAADDLDPNGGQAPFYRVVILDEQGVKVDRWTVAAGDRWFKSVADFFSFVTELYGRAGRTLDAMMVELQSSSAARLRAIAKRDEVA